MTPRLAVPLVAIVAACLFLGASVVASEPFRLLVVDAETKWPVPLVELRTTHHLRWVTDNAGVVAIDAPELFGAETWLTVQGHGYEVPADGFGYRGVRVTPTSGGSQTIEVHRELPAKRLGRLTGAGLFAESQRLGEFADAPESGLVGCDSVQLAEHRDRLFWAWGDTSLAGHPLGLFHTLGATTEPRPLVRLDPPLQLRYDYFRDREGRPRNVAEMPGDGPTWISGLVSLPDESGEPRLGAVYTKIKNGLTVYEAGLCVWDDQSQEFVHHHTHWRLGRGPAQRSPMPEGHASRWTDADGRERVLFGDPFPRVSCDPTFESWSDPASWRVVDPQTQVPAVNGDSIKPHRGSIAFNAFREKWVTVFTQHGGDPSHLGEIWYAEAPSPFGPWGDAVKVVTHDNYTFYNPRLHPELTAAGSTVLLFEGTYTKTFSGAAEPTPRYEYNQVLYRLDLDAPDLRGR